MYTLSNNMTFTDAFWQLLSAQPMSHDKLERATTYVGACSIQNNTHSLWPVYLKKKKNNDGIQSSRWYLTVSALNWRVSWELCWVCKERDVLIGLRWSVCVCVCGGIDLVGQRGEGASKSGSCLIQEGDERAGAPPYQQHLPLFVSPFSTPFTRHLSPHSSTLQGLGCFEQPSWIEMRREERKYCDLT